MIKVQKRISDFIGPDLASRLQSLPRRRKVIALWLFHKCFYGNCSVGLFDMVCKLFEFVLSTKLTSKSHQFTVDLGWSNQKFYVSSFSTSHLSDSILAQCFLVKFNFKKFKYIVKRYLLRITILLFTLICNVSVSNSSTLVL